MALPTLRLKRPGVMFNNMDRMLSPLDRVVAAFDQGLRLLFGPPLAAERASPAAAMPDATLDEGSRTLAGRLMRVNHSGEICAQALYQGQALTANANDVREKLERSAQEENDHLAWTAERVRELGAHLSYLNPAWYAGSFALGALAGLAGDRWSLGFLAETERQVVEHLDGHLARLPDNDQRSRAIIEQMRTDEGHHATVAIEAGARELPLPIKRLMRATARVMTTTAYWI
jgi:3-demethoxyubiquinol 3-hydroxylase